MELNKIQDLISDISDGKMIILMDDEDRENEGDLILAAEKVTAEAINFMATHARGLICLALNQEKCQELNLEPMVKDNGAQQGTAFTASIEAAKGVTTGISAADRTTTILAAVKKNASSKCGMGGRVSRSGLLFRLVALRRRNTPAVELRRC